MPRAARPAPPGSGVRADGALHHRTLLEGVQHHERREEGPAVRPVEHEVFRRQGQHLVEAAAGVPERLNKEAFFLIRLIREQDGHLGCEQVAGHGGAVRGCQVAQRHRRAVVKIARRCRHVFLPDVAVRIL